MATRSETPQHNAATHGTTDDRLRAAMLPWAILAGLMAVLLGGVAMVAYFGLGTGAAGTSTSSTTRGNAGPRPAGPPADGSETAALAATTRGDREEDTSTIRAVSTGQNGVRLRLEAEPDAPTVGDPIPVTLTLSVPEAVADSLEADPFETETLHAGSSWGDAEILRTGSTRRSSSEGRIRLSREVTITVFRSGSLELPPLPLPLGNVELLTPPARLEIRSVLTSGDELVDTNARPADGAASLEARPYHPPVQLPLGRPFWWTAAVLALACLLLAGHLWRQGPVPAESAATAGGALADLLSLLDALRQEASAEAFHVKLSWGLRQYLGRTLDFAATECTTREVVHHLDTQRRRLRRPRLETSRETIDLLHACDRVKFAAAVVDPADLRRRLGETRRLVQNLDRELRPPTRPKSPAAAVPRRSEA